MKTIFKFAGAVAAMSLSALHTAQACVIGVDPNCSAVPEPTSWSLVALGVVGVIVVGRYFKKK